MRIVVLGSTGLLGRATTLDLMARGHDVLGVSLDGRRTAEQPATLRTVAVDIVAAHDVDLDSLVHGADAVVHALGPDDRTPTPIAAATFFRTLLVEPTVRVARAVARQNVPRFVVFGSYFTHFDRLHPEWNLAAHHPYIHARAQQEEGVRRAALGSTEVTFLQIPFVFGTYPDLEPLWKGLFYDLIRWSPVATGLAGRNGATTHLDVARAAANAIEGLVPPGSHPVATDNLSFVDMTRIVRDELGKKPRRVHTVPAGAATLGLRGRRLCHQIRRLDSGLDERYLAADLLSRDLSLDVEASCATWGLTPASVQPAVRETVRISYP